MAIISTTIISRADIVEPTNLPEWVKKIKRRAGERFQRPEDRVKDLFDEGVIPTLMHGSFYSALRELPDNENWSSTLDAYETRLREAKDEKIQNWIAELIQNASDAKATEIEIIVSEEGLRFLHNGDEFKTQELIALMKVNVSTKNADLSTIGKFGIGFKYWWWHFKEIQVSVSSENFIHKLSYKHNFKEDDSIYEYGEGNESRFTEFRFKRPKNRDSWDEFFNSTTDQILGGRISESIPILQRDERNFSISVTIEKPEGNDSSKYECKILRNLFENDLLSIDEISSGKEGEMNKSIRARSSLSHLITLNQDAGNDLLEEALDIYKYNKTIIKTIESDLDGGTDDEKEIKKQSLVKKYAKESFEKSHITIILNPDKELGAISNLFIANEVECSFPYTLDAPWMLTADRHSLGTRPREKKWNSRLGELVNELYSLTISECLKDNENFGFDWKQMAIILNNNIDELLNGIDRYAASVGYYDHFEKTFNINKEDFDIHLHSLYPSTHGFQWKGCSIAFYTIWYETRGDSRKWLEDAMHEKIIFVEIKDGMKIPICNDNNDYYPNHQHELDNSFEICNLFGNGIPSDITEFIQNYEEDEISPNVRKIKDAKGVGRLPTQDDLLETLDYVVIDNNGKNYFLSEVENNHLSSLYAPIIIKEKSDEDERLSLLEELIQLLEEGLDEKIFYFIDSTKNISQRENDIDVSSFENIMQNITTIAFEESGKEDINLEILKEKIFDNRPNDLSWGCSLLTTDIQGNEILVILPPNGHCLALTLGQKSHQILGSFFSVKTSELMNEKQIIINRENAPRILIWGDQENDQDSICYVRTKEIWPLAIPEKNTLDREDLGEWYSSHFILEDRDKVIKNGVDWTEINLDYLQSSAKEEVIYRITPLFIDGFYSRENKNNIHKGLRDKDLDGGIITKYEPLNNKSQAFNRQIEINEEKCSEEILLRAINLDYRYWNDENECLIMENMRTTFVGQGIERPEPNFEDKDGHKPYTGGILRILGPASMITDGKHLNLRDSTEKMRIVHQLSYWEKMISDNISENYTEKILDRLRFNLTFDVVWVTSPTKKTNVMLTSRRIVDGKNPFGDTNIDDNNTPRVCRPTEDNDTFKDLQENGIMGFLDKKEDNWIDNLKHIFSGLSWLPRKVQTNLDEEVFDILYGDVICVKLHDESRIDNNWSTRINTDHTLRPGINRLVEVILGTSNENSKNALEWLDELIQLGMPTKSWLANKRTSIRRKIEENDWVNDFQHIYGKTQMSTGPTWSQFLEAARADATKDQILDEYGDVEIPIMKLVSGYWEKELESNIKINNLEDIGEKWLVIEEKITSNCSNREISYPDTLFKIKEGENILILPDEWIKNKLQEISSDFNDISDRMYEILECDFNYEGGTSRIGGSRNFKYIDTLLQGNSTRSDIIIEWHSYEAREINSDFPIEPGEHCIGVKIENNPNNQKIIKISNIKSSNINYLFLEEHENISIWFYNLLKKYNVINQQEMEILVKSGNINSTWWWMLPINDSGIEIGDKKIDFIREYCPNLLNREDLFRKLEAINDDDNNGWERLEQYYGDLEDMYRNNSKNLKWTIDSLDNLYRNIPTIFVNFSPMSIPGIDNPLSVSSKIDINKWMLPRLDLDVRDEELDGTTLGSNLIVNRTEVPWCRIHGTLHTYDSSERIVIDFAEQAWHILYDGIFGNDAERWFNENSDYINFPELFVLNTGDSTDAKLHKIHAFHILSYLGARGAA